jgi:CDP-glucose 4,6-dehydratase
MRADFWRNKRVFITGHTGFKGSWLSLWLQQLGAKVTGYALTPPTNPNLFDVANVSHGMTSIIGDVRDQASVLQAIKTTQPDIVIHMAAQALLRYSYANPVETYATNVMGSVHVLEAVRQTASVRVVVNVTSDKCYENKEWLWGYREMDPMGGYDPYSNSKGCAELVTAAYRNSFFNPARYSEHRVALASVRAGNVIGGGDWAMDRLIPDIMRAMEAGALIKIRNPHAIRPWQHVLDPLHGYLLLIEKLYSEGADFAEGWNFGANDEDTKPVQWIVERLIALSSENGGAKAAWKLDANPQPHEAHYLKLDCSKAKTHLGWYPRWNLEESLRNVVSWHKNWLQGKDMRNITIRQIESFSQRVR